MEQKGNRSAFWLAMGRQLRQVAARLVRLLGGVPAGDLRTVEAQLAAAQARIAELEAPATRKKKAPEFVKPNRPKPPADQPRRKREQNFARKRETPTRQEDHMATRSVRRVERPWWGLRQTLYLGGGVPRAVRRGSG